MESLFQIGQGTKSFTCEHACRRVYHLIIQGKRLLQISCAEYKLSHRTSGKKFFTILLQIHDFAILLKFLELKSLYVRHFFLFYGQKVDLILKIMNGL
jgi:hypothetical protein